MTARQHRRATDVVEWITHSADVLIRLLSLPAISTVSDPRLR